jgi:hypothetical protein
MKLGVATSPKRAVENTPCHGLLSRRPRPNSYGSHRRGSDVTDQFPYVKRAQEFEIKAAESQDPVQKSAYLQLAAAYRVLAKHSGENEKDRS